jgi:hypothetical protein
VGYYSYKIEHDFGLAPNPFGGYCTLAICKGDIRKNKRLRLGDWVIGTGSVKLKKLHYLIYAMQIDEALNFEEYWDDPRFQYKKPVLNGSLAQLYGDNIYHKDTDSGNWLQDDSAHTLAHGQTNNAHLKADIKGQRVLIAKNFYYFGDNAIKIPDEYLSVCSEGRSVKSKSIPVKDADAFITWLITNNTPGIHGDPINWKNHK